MKQELAKKNPTNHQKAAKTRRQRGYQWEDTIVKRFRKTENWKAFEAKSGTSTSLPVPADQIERCLDWIKTFDIYENKKVLLAFKFLLKIILFLN